MKSNNKSWGLLPRDISEFLLAKEWHNLANLKSRLLGERSLIKINLKPPTERIAIANLAKFQDFVGSWKSYPQQEFIQWETKSYPTLLKQLVPNFFILDSIQDLINAIGKEAQQRSQLWQKNMAPLLELTGNNVYSVLVKHLNIIENMPNQDCILLKNLINQLLPNMGVGLYLRALPLVGIDTKFLENYQQLITDLLDTMYNGELSASGGLLTWLGCLENPKGWLWIRPLCPNTTSKLASLPIMQLPINVLNNYDLPATNILVVENIQSGLGLPELTDTIAVFGGGKNISWMDADWLKDKHVAYWGDIDTWGLEILSDVRNKLPTITPLMMDITTVNKFASRMVAEPKAVAVCPANLTVSEQELFISLKNNHFKASRLEQERLSTDYIHLKINEWLI